MANSPATPPKRAPLHIFGKARLTALVLLLGGLAACIAFSWLTRDAMASLSFLKKQRQGMAASLVDTHPWQTADTLASMAVSAEEQRLAHQAESLADHEVDQTFAAALRQARLDAEHKKLSSRALALQKRIAQLQQLRQQDQARIDKLSAGRSAGKNGALPESAALQVAKAQLGLDSDELNDAQREFERASGDESVRIQAELAAHEQSMHKYDSEVASGQLAVVSVSANNTLAARIRAWLSQRQRAALVEQARQEALQDVATISAQHDALEARLDATASPSADSTSSTQVAALTNSSLGREILSIDDDRIQTDQQLANVYAKWSAQIQLQHQIVLHLILNSLALILAILIATFLSDALVRHVLDKPAPDRRQMRTLRHILQLGIQAVGVILILLVIFGAPQETPTILGLTTAALTFALQDYIVAFLGWFAIMGRNGFHIGDWVEINGVSGEVVDIRLMSTTLLEVGGVANQGQPTGRRTTFMNSFAIRGQYFNFSTAGQWMWDEIVASMPAGVDVSDVARRVEAAVIQETEENMRQAEKEWKHAGHGQALHHLSAAPIVVLRPSSSPIDLGSGIELQVLYVTSAASRFELRTRIDRRIVAVFQEATALNGTPQPETA